MITIYPLLVGIFLMLNPDFYHWNGGARLTLSAFHHGVLVGAVWSGRATPMPWHGPAYANVW
jgi:hypothetical protein